MKKDKLPKPPSAKMLDSRGIAYELLPYAATTRDAEEVAALIGHEPEQVFKTLVVQPPSPQPSSRWILGVVPANQQLDLKLLAQAVEAKKLKMAPQQKAEEITRLQVGGISALALVNRNFDVRLHRSAFALSHLVVSAGQRGLQIKLSVDDFVRVTTAKPFG